jgi:hypothetical protein
VSITIYGASDDLIEVDGDISEEFTLHHAGETGDLLAFSDGTVLRIGITHAGIWRIHPIVRGSAELTIEQFAESDDANYTDRATLSGAVWVVHGVDHATCSPVAQTRTEGEPS